MSAFLKLCSMHQVQGMFPGFTHTHIPQVLCSGSLEKILLKQSQRDFFIVGLIRAFNVLIGM